MTLSCQITQNESWPPRTSDQIQKSPTGCAIPNSQISASPHLRARRTPGCKLDAPCSSFRCRSPSPWGLVSKGGGRGPRPLCCWGSRAKSKRPGAFLPGCGAGSFPEKNAPHVPVVGTTLCGSSNHLLSFCFSSYSRLMASMGVSVSGWQRRMASSTSPSLMASSET